MYKNIDIVSLPQSVYINNEKIYKLLQNDNTTNICKCILKSRYTKHGYRTYVQTTQNCKSCKEYFNPDLYEIYLIQNQPPLQFIDPYSMDRIDKINHQKTQYFDFVDIECMDNQARQITIMISPSKQKNFQWDDYKNYTINDYDTIAHWEYIISSRYTIPKSCTYKQYYMSQWYNTKECVDGEYQNVNIPLPTIETTCNTIKLSQEYISEQNTVDNIINLASNTETTITNIQTKYGQISIPIGQYSHLIYVIYITFSATVVGIAGLYYGQKKSYFSLK